MEYCNVCGTKINGEKFCPVCGNNMSNPVEIKPLKEECSRAFGLGDREEGQFIFKNEPPAFGGQDVFEIYSHEIEKMLDEHASYEDIKKHLENHGVIISKDKKITMDNIKNNLLKYQNAKTKDFYEWLIKNIY